jgi:hypothetical protein
VFDAHGRRRPMTIDQVGFALLVPDLDIHAERRAEIPRAIHGALHGDPALLARLIALSGPSGPDPKRDVNQTLDQVTQCEERGMPFDRTASPEQKLAQAQAALARVPSSVFAPFGPQLAFGVTLVPTCAYWPARPQRPDFGGSLPHVPALLLHGVADQRTTPGETAEIAHALPHSVTIDVPYVGHSTWGTDVTGCVKAAVARFLAGGTPARCRATGNPYAPRPLPPRSLGAVRGGLRAAVAASVDDAFAQLDYLILRRTALLPTERFGGLRGGSAHGTARGLVLDRYSYIRGLEVSGLVPRHGPVRLRANGLLLRNLHVRRETLYEELHARGLLPG